MKQKNGGREPLMNLLNAENVKEDDGDKRPILLLKLLSLKKFVIKSVMK